MKGSHFSSRASHVHGGSPAKGQQFVTTNLRMDSAAMSITGRLTLTPLDDTVSLEHSL